MNNPKKYSYIFTFIALFTWSLQGNHLINEFPEPSPIYDADIVQELFWCPKYLTYLNLTFLLNGLLPDLQSNGMLGTECETATDCNTLADYFGCRSTDYYGVMIQNTEYQCQDVLSTGILGGQKYCTLGCSFIGQPRCFGNPAFQYSYHTENEVYCEFAYDESSSGVVEESIGLYTAIVPTCQCQKFCLPWQIYNIEDFGNLIQV